MAELKNEQHERFCQEYLIDLNATQAYIRCGEDVSCCLRDPKLGGNDPIGMVADALAVFVSEDTHPVQKMAASLLIKMLVPGALYSALLESGDLYPINRNDPAVRDWAMQVTSAGKCAHCGCTKKLEAHHIRYWSEYPMGRLDPNNGICLCFDCHVAVHSKDTFSKLMRGARRGAH